MRLVFTSSLCFHLCGHQQQEDAAPQARGGPPVPGTHPPQVSLSRRIWCKSKMIIIKISITVRNKEKSVRAREQERSCSAASGGNQGTSCGLPVEEGEMDVSTWTHRCVRSYPVSSERALHSFLRSSFKVKAALRNIFITQWNWLYGSKYCTDAFIHWICFRSRLKIRHVH